ncbi:hypothetical protein pb186bvf_017665 [Paramecium bursaria]
MIDKLLYDSVEQHKKQIQQIHRDIRKRRERELFEIERYKIPKRPPFLSQQKVNGDVFQKGDIYLCKEPMIDDFIRYNILSPQRFFEKGLIEVKNGKQEKLDGSMFPSINKSKMGNKEQKLVEYWDKKNAVLAKTVQQEILDSQTGINKKQNQSMRLKNLKVFVPNHFHSELFDEHPSQILSLTALHTHDKTKIWSPPRKSGDFF